MKPHYYEDTDSLYIDLSEGVSTDSRELSDGFVVDYDVGVTSWASTSNMPLNISTYPNLVYLPDRIYEGELRHQAIGQANGVLL